MKRTEGTEGMTNIVFMPSFVSIKIHAHTHTSASEQALSAFSHHPWDLRAPPALLLQLFATSESPPPLDVIDRQG